MLREPEHKIIDDSLGCNRRSHNGGSPSASAQRWLPPVQLSG